MKRVAITSKVVGAGHFCICLCSVKVVMVEIRRFTGENFVWICDEKALLAASKNKN